MFVPTSSIPVPAISRQVQYRPLGSQTSPPEKTVEGHIYLIFEPLSSRGRRQDLCVEGGEQRRKSIETEGRTCVMFRAARAGLYRGGRKRLKAWCFSLWVSSCGPPEVWLVLSACPQDRLFSTVVPSSRAFRGLWKRNISSAKV